ncbi:SDR family NAD(P)-dependent oxidoreductase [Prauserella flavalba]|uniref:Short-chain dehydrogenase n=1 Tax=Prauserella flavalba TaxID=1477506 RepID=A0A318LNH5_9PSEU|nr:SDR family NAD(P)-dependent oxidoreductase [Prauserella flavalba]PXY28656.1 short-chain dehydrogenase [Prauserella flavalba]
MSQRLLGKTAFVTGAAGTLGSAIARAFAGEGVRALVLADLREDGLDIVAKELGIETVTATLDVTDGDAFDGAVADAVERFGTLDVLVNNAGNVSPNARVHNLSTKDFDDCVAVNLTGTFHGVRAGVRAMRGRGRLSIVNTASVAGLTAWPYCAPYSAAKAAVIHFSRVAALEYVKEDIRVNCVCPGAFPSTLTNGLPDGALDVLASRHPGGFGTAEDLVGAVVYLASDESRWTTGHALVVDGGYSLP